MGSVVRFVAFTEDRLHLVVAFLRLFEGFRQMVALRYPWISPLFAPLVRTSVCQPVDVAFGEFSKLWYGKLQLCVYLGRSG